MNLNDGDARPVIWLLSAYRADSHAAWADWLQRRVPGVRWCVLELPGRHFRWRIRGNPLSWLGSLPADAPDRILATSMVDLATLKGLNPGLAEVPACYYFHENQFAYPVSDRQSTCLEPQMVQLYGALAAQHILFNSAYNRDSFLDGVSALLCRLPDAVPDGVTAGLAAKAQVLPVPVEPIAGARHRDQRLIVWNHRWEYDKGPDLFAEALVGLKRLGSDFRVALLGPRPQDPPEALRLLRRELGARIVVDGKVERREYQRTLARAGIVVSTAIHEFQGLGVMEAVGAGCRPLVPDDLCYREQYPDGCRYPSGDVTALYTRLRQWLDGGLPAAVDIGPWSERCLLPEWLRVLDGPC